MEAFTGASRGLDIANLKHRFASSNSRARTKSQQQLLQKSLALEERGGGGWSQSLWHSGSQELKLAVAGSLGALFALRVLHVNFFQDGFISQILFLKHKWLIAFSSGLGFHLCGLRITNNTPISKGPEGRMKPSYIYTLCSVPGMEQVK